MIKTSLYYKMGQAYATKYGILFLLLTGANIVKNWVSSVIINWDKCNYKLGKLLQIREIVTEN